MEINNVSSRGYRPDEFSSSLPPHIPIYTDQSCTLHDLTLHLAATDPSLLPNPAIGTRVSFRLIFPDARGASSGPARFMVEDLGSVVIGEGGPGAKVAEGDEEDNNGRGGGGRPAGGAATTLEDARYVVGDYISCAILPPLENGAVAPASHARTGRGAGIGEGVASRSAPGARRENGFEFGRRGRGPRVGGGVGFGARGGPGSIPMGEWRRGERLPDAPSRAAGRGRGRW